MHAGSLHFKAPFGKIMAVISSLTPPPWTIMSAGPTTGKASKDAGFHHLITNSRPWYKNPRQFPLSDLKKSPNSFWRIGIIVLNLFVSLLYANHNPLKRISDSWTSCRLITSSTTGYDSMSFEHIYIARVSYIWLIHSAGSMMSTYQTIFKNSSSSKLILQTVYNPFLSGNLLSIIQVVEEYVFKYIPIFQ